MQMKKVIINADDFGYSENNNIAIKKGYDSGIITSTSLMANMKGFDDAVFNIIPQIPNIDLGFHFNIAEGKSLSNPNLLCDTNGNFNNSYLKLIYNSNNKNFLSQVEQEFRIQIEKVLKYTTISHLDSHVHIHAIPEIFNIMAKLADEYKIKYIRTQQEIPYIVFSKVVNTKFPINIIKNILLNCFTYYDKNLLKKYKVLTNDYFIGVLYTGYMDEKSIINGLKRIKKDNTVTEIIFHPYLSDNISADKQNNYNEYLITQIPNFKQKLENLGFVLSDYTNISHQ